jgi:hypothetical protein
MSREFRGVMDILGQIVGMYRRKFGIAMGEMCRIERSIESQHKPEAISKSLE